MPEMNSTHGAAPICDQPSLEQPMCRGVPRCAARGTGPNGRNTGPLARRSGRGAPPAAPDAKHFPRAAKYSPPLAPSPAARAACRHIRAMPHGTRAATDHAGGGPTHTA
jgi:hypothetical protein